MQPGDLISGKYRLLRLLGAGGMGSVWAARNELTDRDFAIKFLLPDLAQNKEALHRFFLEARACGQIKHPAVVDVYDMGQAEDGSPYLVMELLEGEGFDHRLARAGVFPAADAAAWIAFVARGLEEAHVRGLVHRDLKPGNIFFALDDRGDVLPKVLDFGVSKATGAKTTDFVKTTTGAVLGSPAYMSPEQAKGETDVDGRSDVWSLGVILYEALTGRIPFDAPNYNALMVTIMMQVHRPIAEVAPSVPAELAAIVDMALAKDKNQRIGTARELADRLESVVAKIGTGPYFPQFQPRTGNAGTTPLPQFGLRTDSSPEAVKAAGGKPSSTTQGPWSDARPTLRRVRRISPAVWIAATVLGLAIVAGGAVLGFRSRQPMAAVAGRSAAALTTGLSRLQAQLDQVRAEVAAEQRAKVEAESKPAAPASDTGSAAAKAPPKGPAGPAGAAVPAGAGSPAVHKKPSKDPHGGVDSAGF